MKKGLLLWLLIAVMVFSPMAAFADVEEAPSDEGAQAEAVLDEEAPAEEVSEEAIPAEEAVEEVAEEAAEEAAEEVAEEAVPEEEAVEEAVEEVPEEAVPEEEAVEEEAVVEEAAEEEAAPAEEVAVPNLLKDSASPAGTKAGTKATVDPYDACTWVDASMTQAKDANGKLVKGLFKAKRAQGGIGLYYAGSDYKVVKKEKVITVSSGWRFIYSKSNGETFWNNVSDNTYTYLIRDHNGDFYIENLEGIYSVAGNKHYVKKNGTVRTTAGFVEVKGKTYYIKKDGIVRTKNGWINYKGKKYRMSGGTVRTKPGPFQVGDYRYVVKDDGTICTKVGPVKVNGNLYYVRNSKGTLGYYKAYKLKGKTYHVNKKGLIRVGRHKWKDKKWYYSAKKGYLKSKKVIVTAANGERCLVEKTGEVVTNQKFTFNNRQYIAKKNGVIYTGLFKWKGTLYYASDMGVLKRKAGIYKVGENSYYVQAGGVVVTNQKIWFEGSLYIADSDGHLLKGFFKYGGYDYYGDDDYTVRYSTRFTVNNKTYFANSKGWIQKGIFTFQGKYYYADQSGALDTTAKYFWYNGKRYYNKNGGGLACKEWLNEGDKYYYASSSAAFITGKHTMDNGVKITAASDGTISREDYQKYIKGDVEEVEG